MITTPIFPPSKQYTEKIRNDGTSYLSESPEYQRISKFEDSEIFIKAQLQAQADRSEFLEDCMAELAVQAYQ